SYGGRVGSISSRAERIDLGLIAGEGAKNAVVESLEIFRVAKPLENEIRGLVRIGKRRWNLELEGGRKILLPEQGAVEAMEKLIVWDAAEQVFLKDFEYFDLRIAERPTVRLREPKPGEI
ncbi:MAG: cell division protein FtsQ/DivIB, partial [Albidovulum sp.]|nr:cell division protein FtsQ/DivIB [Albidovulum sp.]